MKHKKERAVEFTQLEKQKKKKKFEAGLMDLEDNIKQTNICIIGVPKGEESGRKLI